MRIFTLKNKVFWICITFWSLITLTRLINHQPWADEALAWSLVKYFQFGSILDSLKYEGHFFVWYLILLPFAKFDLWYPYSMLIMNWLFCFGAICIMWIYAPFNNWLKAFITFSFPFLAYYSVVARCYSIGILLLFILCCLYKDKLKHPIIYSIIIFFCANTSIIALFGSFAFGILLLFDLFRNKQFKDLKICLSIVILEIIAFIVQTIKVQTTNIAESMAKGIHFSQILNLFPFPHIINAILLIGFICGFLYCLSKDKKTLFFISLTYCCMFYLFRFWYAGDFWHHYFFYIYLICACWMILYSENITENTKKMIIILLCSVSLIYIFGKNYEPRVYSSQSKVIAEYMKTKQDACLILKHPFFVASLPYLNEKDFDIVVKMKLKEPYTIEEIKEYINLNKVNYIFFYKDLKENIEGQNYKNLKFILDKNIASVFYIYKIEIIKN